MKKIKFPLKSKKDLESLEEGEEVLVSGVIYTARDKVHQKLSSPPMQWPFDLKNNAIYYCGPTPASDDFPMGSCGPTTSSRMDQWSAELYSKGLGATIGKGPRSDEVAGAIEKAGAVYFVAFGGCGALYGSAVKKAEKIAFQDLGPQAVYRAEIEDFPLIAGIVPDGGNIFKRRN